MFIMRCFQVRSIEIPRPVPGVEVPGLGKVNNTLFYVYWTGIPLKQA